MYTIKGKPHNELPPTSQQIKEHLKRSYYTIHLLCYDQFGLKPYMSVWECIDVIMISEKGHLYMPGGYCTITCGSQSGVCQRRCILRVLSESCTEYWECEVKCF